MTGTKVFTAGTGFGLELRGIISRTSELNQHGLAS